MHTRTGASPADVLSQLTTAVAGAACFVAAIGLSAGLIGNAKIALFKPLLSVSPAQFTRIGSVKFELNHQNRFAANTIATPDLNSLVHANVDHELKKISRLEAHARWERRLLIARLNEKLRRTEERNRALRARALAARERVPESARLQFVQRSLFRQFQVAMNETPAMMSIQLAKAVNTHRENLASRRLDSAPRTHFVQVARVHRQRRRAQTHHPRQAPVMVAVRKRSKPHPAVAMNSTDRISLNAAAETNPTLSRAGPVAQPSPLITQSQRVKRLANLAENMMGYGDFPVPPKNEPVHVTVTSNDPPPPAAKKIGKNTGAQAKSTQNTPPTSEAVSFLGKTLVLPTEYPTLGQAAYSKPAVVAMNTRSSAPPAPVNTQSPPPVRKPARTQAWIRSAASQGFVNEDSTPQATAAPDVSFVEAFDWSRTVSDAQAEILTREDPLQPYGHSQAGWRIVRSAEHWPTVYWNSSEAVPLISENTARMLSLRASVSLQNDAGIVIAKVPAGWSLDFSGRAERPLVFNETDELLENDGSSQVRYYVFLNASPGARILYLMKGSQTGAVALPVFGGMTSYLDLSHPQEQTLSGRILDAASSSVQPLPGVRVQVIGTGQSTVTNLFGEYQIENVVTFGNTPVFVQAETHKGYPQRYELNPEHFAKSLFFMSDDQIQGWIGELEGGVSPESGVVIGALPNIAAAHAEGKPLPKVKSLATDATLSPETYTMSNTGQLLVKTAMSATNSRFFGVQVPEGPALAELKDDEGRVIWSQLLVISPRVLSVVGPY